MSFSNVVKKITSILLIVAMVMTSTGITTFAESINNLAQTDETSESENVSRKYYDEVIEESKKEASDEALEEVDKADEAKDAEIEEEAEKEDETEQEEETEKEDETEKEASDKDDEQKESESSSDFDTVKDDSEVSNEEIASDSDATEENSENTEEKESDEEGEVRETRADDEASASETDEENDENVKNDKTNLDIEDVISKYLSDVSTMSVIEPEHKSIFDEDIDVATDSDARETSPLGIASKSVLNLDEMEVASGSEADKLFGWNGILEVDNIRTYIVWGDVGYVPPYHANQKLLDKSGFSGGNVSWAKPFKWYVWDRENSDHNFSSAADKQFLTEHQNIRGYVYDTKTKDSVTLTAVDGVTFNNDWQVEQTTADAHYHIEGGKDQNAKYIESFAGIFVDVTTGGALVIWENNGWEQGRGTKSLWSRINYINPITIPKNTKNIRYKDGYTFVGWAPQIHMTSDQIKEPTLNADTISYPSKGDSYDGSRPGWVETVSAYLLTEGETWPGARKLNYRFDAGGRQDSLWDGDPVCFGPFYRSGTFAGDSDDNGYSRMLRDGWRYGLADKGLIRKHDSGKNNTDSWTWQSFVRVDRQWSKNDQIEKSGFKYSVIFMSPVFVKNYDTNLEYDLGGGSWNSGYTAPTKYSVLDEITLPTKDNISKTGYVFDAWYTEANGKGTKYTKLGEDEAVAGINKLYANWIENTYKVQLKKGQATGTDGNKYGSFSDHTAVSYKYTEKIKMPNDWNVTGFKFLGFSKTSDATTATYEAGKEYNIKDMSLSTSKTTALYPVWEEKKYNIGFKGGKKTGSDGVEYTSANTTAVKSYKHYESLTLPGDYKIDNDFTFAGFGKTEKDNTKIFNAGATIKAGEITDLSETSDNYLYGSWNEKKTTITFMAGRKKGSNGDFVDSNAKVEQTYSYKSKVTIPSSFTLTGFNLKGYNTVVNSDAVKVSLDTDMTARQFVDNGYTNLYATWKEKEYKVEFVGGSIDVAGKTYTSSDKVDAAVYEYYRNVSMPKAASMKIDGFKLIGFNKEDKKSEAKYEPDKVVKITDLITYIPMVEDDGTDATINRLYGVWENTKASVTLEAVNGSFENGKRTKVVNMETSGLALKEYTDYEEPVGIDGYVFDHWIDEDNNELTKDSVVIGNKTLKATYKLGENHESKTKYVIDVENDDAKGTYGGEATFEIELNATISDAMRNQGITNPVAGTDYEFIGWSWYEDDTTKLIKDTDTYSDTDKTTIYAVYKKSGNIYVTLEAVTGQFTDGKRTKVLTSDTSIELMNFANYEKPVRDKYEFAKWMNGTVEVKETDVITSSMTLTAVYIAEDVNIDKYAINVENDATKGTYTGPASFEVALNGNVKEAMTAAGVVEPTELPGYTFAGFAFAGDETNYINDTTVYTDTSKATIKAIYTDNVPDITLTLDAGIGLFADKRREKVLTSKTLKAVNAFDGYELPVKDGYFFDKWVDGEDNEVASTSIITVNTKLTAKYKTDDGRTEGEVEELNKYTVSIENDGTKGTYTSAATTFEIGLGDNVYVALASASIASPSALPGYEFKGWSWTGSETDLIDDTSTYTDAANNKLIAVYVGDSNLITVTLKSVTGAFVGGKREKEVTKVGGGELRLFDGYEVPTRDGYNFVSWLDGDIEVASTSIISENKTLTASYKKIDDGIVDEEQQNVYIVNIENDDAKGTFAGPASFEIRLGDKIYVALASASVANPVAKSGYTFMGWSWNTEDINKLINDTDTYEDVDNTVLKAVYKEEGSYNVTLDAGTGKFVDGERTKVLTSREAKALNQIADYEEPKREGYVFDAWYNGDAKVASTSVVNSDMTLVAGYRSEESVSDIFIVNISNNDKTKGIIKVKGVETDNARFSVKYGDRVIDALTRAGITVEEVTGYKFEGWSWTGNIYELVKADEVYSDQRKINLIPVYTTVGSITVTLKADTGVFKSNGKRVLNIEADNTTQLGLFASYEEPVKSGDYTFAGWVREDDTSVSVATTSTFASNTVLLATYEDEDGNVIKKDGEEGAVYSVIVKNEIRKGTMSNATREAGARYETAVLDFKLSDNVMDAINAKGLTVTAATGFVFDGYAYDDETTLLTDTDTYDNKDKSVINVVYYDSLNVEITLNANTGLFTNGGRTKTITSTVKKELSKIDNYEEPTKSEGWSFIGWEKADGTAVNKNDMMSASERIELFAIWKDPSGNTIGKDDDTKDGGKDSKYTIDLKTDETKGTLGTVTRFEVKKDANILKTMKDAGVTDPTTIGDWNFWGWSFSNDISDVLTEESVYTEADKTKTALYAQYYAKGTFVVSLVANTGIFDNNQTTKTITSDKWTRLDKFAGYEEPKKSAGFTFKGWQDASGNAYAKTTIVKSTIPINLYATYEKNGKDIGKKDSDTEEGKENATYTVRIINNNAKGTYTSAETFEIKLGDNIYDALASASIVKPTAIAPNYFVGWSFDGEDGYATALTAESVYKNTTDRTLYALYTSEVYNVTLDANVGMFANGSRRKLLLAPQHSLLLGLSEYEEPTMTPEFTFDRWEKDGIAIAKSNLPSYTLDENNITLLAIYKDADGNDVGKNEEDEEKKYTVRVINDDDKGTYDGSKYFGIKLNENIMATMEGAGVKEGVGKTGYVFQGWIMNNDKFLDRTMSYTDKDITELRLTYVSDSYKSSITFDAWAGLFSDGSRYKNYTDVAAGRIINTLSGYEEPTKPNWTFSRWVDEDGNTVDGTSTIRSGSSVLNARYIDADGNEIGAGMHNHFVCGATESCAHEDGVLRVHSFASSYIAITEGSEIARYVNAELAKDVADRKNVYIYLLNDIEISDEIELDTNIKLYICLNGHNLTTKKILARAGSTNSEVIITNCQDVAAEVVEAESENNAPMFGTNGIHIFGNENVITLKPQAALVETEGELSETDKEVVLQNVNIEGVEVKDLEFISIENNSNIKFVDVNIKDIVSDKAIIKIGDSSSLLIGNNVKITNCQSAKAIIDADGILNVANNAKLEVNDNTINKNENGANGIILLGSVENFVSGDLTVTNNKVEVTDEYLDVLKNGPKEENESIFGSVAKFFGGLFGVFAEEESPAGDVGYTAAIGLKNAKTTIEVKDSEIVVIDNKSSEKAEGLKAGYMYNVLSNDVTTPIFMQVKGTLISTSSEIGVAFATIDGEGNITYNKEIDSRVFKSTTYGKENKILGIKESSMGYDVGRKSYQVEYNEGAPITQESNTLIPVLTREGATVSEAIRFKTSDTMAGYDTLLEDDTVYTATGFDLASFSIVRPSNKITGTLVPKSTLSYVKNIYDDDEEIAGNEVIRAVANWKERKVNSETRDVVITQEEYEEIINNAEKAAEDQVASSSDADQVKVESDDDYYTVRYWLDGGRFDWAEAPELEYIDDTEANRKEKYVLYDNVIKTATESDVSVSYDFMGWSLKEASADDLYGRSEANVEFISELNEGVEGDLVEVVANYKPSTYKITYHLNGGNINGATEDVEDTVVRKSDYTLIKNVAKEGNTFIGWTKDDAEVSEENPIITEIKAETLEADIEVFAQYGSAYYSVKYYLDGGKINGVDSVDDIYVDETADITKDYYYLEGVEKEGYDFIGWVTADGDVPVDTIEVGDKDPSKREVKALYRSISYTVNYDPDGGNIVGVDVNVATPSEGKIYILYTNVVKEGYEFLGWYDVKTDRQILSIGNAQVGEVYNVKAKWAKLTYSLTLHLGDGKLVSADATGDYTINDISNKVDYVLPTDIEIEDSELQDWYYVKNGVNQTLISIKAGNVDNITDVYARYENLVTHTINYYTKRNLYDGTKDEIIPGVEPIGSNDKSYDPENSEWVYREKVNRRNNHYLYGNVESPGKIFIGWTTTKHADDSLDIVDNADKIITVKPGITKEAEENEPGLKDKKEYNYYPYFITKPEDTTTIKYVLNGGFLPGKMTDKSAEYLEQTSVEKPYAINQNIVRDGYRFDGWYLDGEYNGNPIDKYIYEEVLKKYTNDTLPVYAKWTKILYSLKYNVKGGTMLGKVLAGGSDVYNTTFNNETDTVLDTNITKEGHRFDGWYDGEGEDAKEVKVIPAGTDRDIEVYASWVKDTYDITYVLEGGKIDGVTGDTYKVTYNKNEVNTLITDIEKDGHEFMGWFTERDGQGDKKEVIEAGEDIADGITVYAYFIDTRYKVTFILDGGILKGKRLDSEGKLEEVYDNRNEVVLYNGEKVSKGYDMFLGWVDEGGQNWTTIPVGHEGDLTLKATYKAAMVELVYNFAGGIIPGLTTKDDTTYKVKYNSTEDYTLITDIKWQKEQAGKPECIFDGWKTKDGKKITMIPKNSKEQITEVVASWYYGGYHIIYHTDGGKIGLQEPNIAGYIVAGGNVYVEKKLAKPEKKNSIFEGWYINEDFSGESVTAIPSFPTSQAFPTIIKDGIIHLYAKWKQEQYTVTYNVEEGAFKNTDVKGNTLKVKVENKYPYILLDEENLSYKGYEFDGWYKKNAKGEFVGKQVVWIDAGNKDSYELYAKFVNLETATDEEKTALENNKKERQDEKAKGQAKKDKMVQDDKAAAKKNITITFIPTSNHTFDSLTNKLVEEDQNRKNNSSQSSSSKSLLGKAVGNITSLFGTSKETKLYGDDDDTEDVVEVNTASLNAYDSVSMENLGIKEKPGYVFNRFILTYIEDENGNNINDELLGTSYTANDNFSAIAAKYPNATIGGRVLFIDETVINPPEPTPQNPSRPSRPGNYNGRNNNGGGGGGGGRIASGFGAAFGGLIVNPYGYDGKGNDNGALRANLLKNQLYIAMGSPKRATTNVANYGTINLNAGELNKALEASSSWEYFPASNNYKFYIIDQLGRKKYITNGWYEYSFASNKSMWYRFDENGLMQRGFIEENGKIYYLNNDDNTLGYMVTGYKDFPASMYTACFNADGSLKCFIPTAARSQYENHLLSLTNDMTIDQNILAICMAEDQTSNKLVSTKKVSGQCAMGNFVGYWYTFANGVKKLRFETINQDLQAARYVTNGWINVYDDNNVLSSYRFDENAKLMTNVLTAENVLVGADGHMAGANLLFNYATDKDKLGLYMLASRTDNNLPMLITNMPSQVVNGDGIIIDERATNLMTTIDYNGVDPVMSFGTYSTLTNAQTLQYLYAEQNGLDTASFANIGLANATATHALAKADDTAKENNFQAPSKVISNIRTLAAEVSENSNDGIIGIYKYLMQKAVSLFIA